MDNQHGFYTLRLPNGRQAFIPNDIEISVPDTSEIEADRLHSLAYIPWHDKYAALVPEAYAGFFAYALPFLRARTTDVHTAFSASHLRELIDAAGEQVDEAAAYYGIILHDCGWPLLGPDQLAASLDYSGLYSERAREPKLLHATLGAERAKELLGNYADDLGLSAERQDFISKLVLYHDRLNLWPVHLGPEPIESQLVVDADALWSYTYENFWLDTIRKNIQPHLYIENVAASIADDYVRTPQGKAIARRLVAARRQEVALCPVEQTDYSTTFTVR